MPDDVDDRLSRRFDDGGGAGGDGGDDGDDDQSRPAQQSQTAQNIKKEWNVRSFYLDDALDDELSTAFKRLDLEVSQSGDASIDLKKTRHFYPLIVRLGLDQLESMDVTDVVERLEE